MLTKDLSIAERVQPRFIEPMYAEGVKELPALTALYCSTNLKALSTG
jgi:hypothetical protein